MKISLKGAYVVAEAETVAESAELLGLATKPVAAKTEVKGRRISKHKKHLFKIRCPRCAVLVKGKQGLGQHVRWNHPNPAGKIAGAAIITTGNPYPGIQQYTHA